MLAPVNGMYGIQDPETAMVGPFNKGTMFGSVEVFLFILSIGGFMTVVFATGALELERRDLRPLCHHGPADDCAGL